MEQAYLKGRAVAAGQQLVEQQQAKGGLRVFRAFQTGHVERDRQFAIGAGKAQVKPASTKALQLDGSLCRGQCACGQRAEMFSDHLPDLRQGDIADDDQNGIVGRVPLLIPLGECRVGQTLDVMHPAQNRVFIRACYMGRGFEPFVDLTPQVVVDGRQPFLFDDL